MSVVMADAFLWHGKKVFEGGGGVKGKGPFGTKTLLLWSLFSSKWEVGGIVVSLRKHQVSSWVLLEVTRKSFQEGLK